MTGENEMSEIRYPDVGVQLTGEDGNAMFVIGRVTKELRRAKVPNSEISAFVDEATSGDYDNVLTTAMQWVSVS